MVITVQVKPKKKNEFVKQISRDYYIVSVKEPPVEGKANQAVVKALSKFFNCSSSEIVLILGHKIKMKQFEIPNRYQNFEILPKQKQLF